MANTGPILNAVVILLVINILSVTFTGLLGASTIGDLVINALFEEDTIETTNQKINPELDAGLQKDLQQTATQSTSFILLDGLKSVYSAIITIATLGFALANMLIQTGSPFLLTLLVGLPVAIGYYISIISAIRGFSL